MFFRCFFLLFIVCSVSAQSPILPTPAVYKPLSESIWFGNQLSINDEYLPDNCKTYLAGLLTNQMKMRAVFSSSGHDLNFKKITNVPQDYYTINIDEKITITYSTEAGCFYAINSLYQLMNKEDVGFTVFKCFLQDYPKFSWRGMHLDVARHFFTVDEVKRFIDLIAFYKFNTFHWHLTDDQGWRIEIKKYPLLTEIGGWRDSTMIGHYKTEPRQYDTTRYGGFYTQEDIKEVVAYAASKYVNIVPEIEMPGHARAALAAYPNHSCTGKKLGVPGEWGVFEEIFCAKEGTIDFLKDVLSEVIELFPSEYIHIGGDEAPKIRWKTCPKCQKVIRENGLKNEDELQSFFIREIDKYLTANNRKLIGWDEILEGGLSPNAAVMSWRGMKGGIEAARQEHYVVMTPTEYCYFDHYQSLNANEPLAIGGLTTLEKVYAFNPIPKHLEANKQAYILGAQGNLWTEYIDNFKKLEYMAFPRAIALANVVWSVNKPEYLEFQRILIEKHFDLLDHWHVNYSKAILEPKMNMFPSDNGVLIRFEPQFKDEEYAVKIQDGDELQNLKIKSAQSIEIHRSSNDLIDTVRLALMSNLYPQGQTYLILNHPFLNGKVELSALPNERFVGQGTFTLVDGIKGKRPWNGAEWLGFDTSKLEIILDAGKKVNLNAVELSFLEDPTSWIYAPTELNFYVAKNKKKWKQIATVSSMDKAKEIWNQPIRRKARFVKIVVNSPDKISEGKPGSGHKPWLFMDEIMLFFKE